MGSGTRGSNPKEPVTDDSEEDSGKRATGVTNTTVGTHFRCRVDLVPGI